MLGRLAASLIRYSPGEFIIRLRRSLRRRIRFLVSELLARRRVLPILLTSLLLLFLFPGATTIPDRVSRAVRGYVALHREGYYTNRLARLNIIEKGGSF